MRRVVAFILAVCCSAPVFAEPPPAEGQSDSNSFLQQLNQEVRTACRRANEGLVRVQVPAELANPAVDVIRKWEPRLNPERRRSKPTGDASTTAPVNSDAARPVPGIDLEPHVVTVGLVIDEKGTLLVPAYLDPARVDRPFIIITGGGITSEATMLAADKSTGVTLLRMREPMGKPLKLADQRPDNGMLLIALCGDETRLNVWTGASRESAVVILPSSEIAVLRGGRYLGGPGYASLVRQLLDEGTVRRPSLGLRVAELPPQEHPRLARVRATDRPGLVVAAVAPDQPGAAAGVQVGDLLLEIAGHPVPDVTTVAAVLAEVRDRTTLTLGRDDERIQVQVELGEPHPPHDK